MDLNQLLDICANGCSDYRLAKNLDVTRQRISGYRNGHNVPKDDVVDRMIELSGIDPVEAYLAVYAERIDNEMVANALRTGRFHYQQPLAL